MARERSSSSTPAGSASPCWLCHGPTSSSTAPPDLSWWTANVGAATAAVVLVTTRRRGNGRAKRCDHRPSSICCGDRRVRQAAERERTEVLLAGRHLPTGWQEALIAACINYRPRSLPPAHGALCSGSDGRSRG